MAGYRNGLITGLALGIVATLFSPTLWRWGRPVAKSAVKGGLDVYDAGRESVGRIGEAVEDLVAEAQFERAVERQGGAVAGAAATAGVTAGGSGPDRAE
jgi:hypothetical protein